MKENTRAVRRGLFETGLVVLSWFVLNIAMGSSTKWIFLYGQICEEGAAQVRTCQAFKFPLTVTVIHMLFSWAMCAFQLRFLRPRPTDKASSMSLKEQLRKIVPLSVCFSLSVAMGNLSLKYIFPSFNQMLGAMSPLITVALAVVMQRKRYNWWTWVSMPVICGGLVVCTTGEVNFNALGAFYATGATVLRAVKSLMQGRLLEGDKMNSVTLLFYMAPWAGVFLQLLALYSEGLEPQLMLLRSLVDVEGEAGAVGGAPHRMTGGVRVLMLLICSGFNACLLNVANFMVTSYTSPVTLQVLGNVKSCLSIAVSVAIFGNPLSVEQGMGVFVCLFGVWIYNQRGGPAAKPQAAAAKHQEVELKGSSRSSSSP